MKEYEGLIGIVIGVILGYLLPVLTSQWNKWKSLYVDVHKLHFSYPMHMEEALITNFSVYVYNDSSLPKGFMFKSLVHEPSGLHFYLEQYENGLLIRPTVLQINPFSAENLKFKASFDPSSDMSTPDIENSNGILTYRTGKTVRQISIPMDYYSPV
jgi:hypothetical protein